jgi:hypothetical protein
MRGMHGTSRALPRLATVAFGVVAGSILASQIVLSRLLSATLGYYFGFMIVSMVMVGLGAGALLVQQLPHVFTAERQLRHASNAASMTGVLGFIGTLTMLLVYPSLGAQIDLGLYDFGPVQLGIVFWCFFPMYFSGGVVVSLLLMHAHARFHRLYAIDLLSAALGAVLALLALESMSPSEAMLGPLAVLPLLSAACFALASKLLRRAVGVVVLALTLLLASNVLLQHPHLKNPAYMTRLGWNAIVNEWNAFSNVSVYPGRFFSWAMSNTYNGPAHEMLDLMIDGIGGTQIVRFDGQPESLARYDYLRYDLTQLAHELVPSSGRQLIIGPGGGVDILQSYRHGRRDITVVEINPLVAEIVNEDLRAFSGSPYNLPGVTTNIENGRTFIKRTQEHWDLISLTWVDTGGSRTAMALNEDYLYTVDSYAELIARLTANGYLGFMRSLGIRGDTPLDSSRGIAIAIEALRRHGVTEPERNIIVTMSDSKFFFNRPMVLVLVKRSAITREELAVTRAFTERLGFMPIWLPDGSITRAMPPKPYSEITTVIHDLLNTRDAEQFYRDAPVDVRPPTDDRPFYFIQSAGPNREANLAKTRLAHSLYVLLTLAVPFLVLPLIPLVRKQQGASTITWTAMAFYALLGLGFMMVEVELFHVLGLALGRPTLSLSVVLGSLLVFSGIGSLCAPAIVQRGAPWLVAAFALLIGLLTLLVLGKSHVLAVIVAQPLWLRVFLSIAVVAPIGVLMGTPMSMGMTVLAARPDLTIWGWALNAVCSVLGSVVAMYLATTTGIASALLLGATCYAGACALLVAIAKQQASARSASPVHAHRAQAEHAR